MNESQIEQLVQSSSAQPPEYLYYLLGGQVLGEQFQAQSAGDVADIGKTFFQKWKDEIRKAVCGKDGVYEQFVKGVVTKKDVPKLVAIAILTGSPVVGGVVVTQVAAVYLALLVVQTGIGAYCAGYKDA